MSRRRVSPLRVHRAGVPRRRPTTVPPCPPAVPASAPPPPPDAEERIRQAEIEHDLSLARDLQQGLLLAAVPALTGWEMSAVSNPARDLGGDLYDFLPLAGGWHGIMIGDVSGKGLPAALRMAVARTMFRYSARTGDSPAATLAHLNRGIYTDLPQGMITMLYLQLHTPSGTLRMANAGHTYALLLNGDVTELELTGVPLGVLDESDYRELTLTVPPGSTLLLYTDGVTETTNATGTLFSEQFEAVLAAHPHRKPRALLRHILHELRTWAGGRAADDDVTVVVLRRRLLHLADELATVCQDVLGSPAGEQFWAAQVARLPADYRQVPNAIAAAWLQERLPTLQQELRQQFPRGLTRELIQQLRLTVEEYRASTPPIGAELPHQNEP